MGEAGRAAAYETLWKDRDKDEVDLNRADRSTVLDHKLATETIDAIENGPTSAGVGRFDAVLVDEGQDFLPNWWDALKLVRREGGEMLLVADRSQDIYGRADAWTEDVMKGAGFTGRWNDLATSYRMPTELTGLLADFGERYQAGQADVAPVLPAQQEIPMLTLRWRQVTPGHELAAILEELDEVVKGGTYSDLGILTSTRIETKKIERALKLRGIKPASTVADDGDKGVERMLKRYFFQGREKVKVTPVPNFKGREISRAIVLLSGPNAATAYTALSRLSVGDFGSSLSVISSEPSFESFGRTWPHFFDEV